MVASQPAQFTDHILSLQAVKRHLEIPLIVKISPYFSSVANMVRRLESAGADGVSLFNRFYQPDFDLEERKSWWSLQPVAEVDDQGIEEGRLRLADLMARERPDLPSFYLEPKKIGWLRMGVGSALTPKLLLRTEGRTRAEEDDFLLEARELSDLSQISCVDTATAHRAVRVLQGYGRMGRIKHEIVVVVPAPAPPVPPTAPPVPELLPPEPSSSSSPTEASSRRSMSRRPGSSRIT